MLKFLSRTSTCSSSSNSSTTNILPHQYNRKSWYSVGLTCQAKQRSTSRFICSADFLCLTFSDTAITKWRENAKTCIFRMYVISVKSRNGFRWNYRSNIYSTSCCGLWSVLAQFNLYFTWGFNRNTVKLGYSNIGFWDTLSIASNIQWYELIPHKATVFIPYLVRHAQMHQPRM
jgi:hypothetical protein